MRSGIKPGLGYNSYFIGLGSCSGCLDQAAHIQHLKTILENNRFRTAKKIRPCLFEPLSFSRMLGRWLCSPTADNDTYLVRRSGLLELLRQYGELIKKPFRSLQICAVEPMLETQHWRKKWFIVTHDRGIWQNLIFPRHEQCGESRCSE